MNARRTVAVAVLCVFLLSALPPASAGSRGDDKYDGVKHWWEYDPKTWHHTWKDEKKFREIHQHWHDEHKKAGDNRDRHFHRELQRRYRREHHHDPAGDTDRGQATWYDADGAPGACGNGLHGFYAASRTLPCGSLVSVRSGDRYVFVRIGDRGPFGDKNRILDLSPKAFKKLAALSLGVVNIKAVRLKNG